MKPTQKTPRLLLAAAAAAGALLTACGGSDSPSAPPPSSPFEGRWVGTFTSGQSGTGDVRFDIRCEGSGCATLGGTCSLDAPSCRLQDGTFSSAAGTQNPTEFQCRTATDFAAGPIEVSGSQITGNITGCAQGTIALRRQ